MTQLVTVNEAAELLACTPAAIRKWLSQGRLQRVKLGRLTRIRQSDLVKIATTGIPSRK